MADKTKISWTEATWNPIRGCSRVSEGCRNCYAEQVANRFSGPGQPYEGLINKTSQGPKWNGNITFVDHVLPQPIRWQKPRRIFVNSMSDLFHENVTDEMLDRIFAVMALSPQHTFQILTKRPQRMREYLSNEKTNYNIGWECAVICREYMNYSDEKIHKIISTIDDTGWPLKNVWLGVSVENQATADERIPLLLDTHAAIRWISAEPLLGPLDILKYLLPPVHHHPDNYQDNPRLIKMIKQAARGLGWTGLDWVVVGGESGPNARPFKFIWARQLLWQCGGSKTPVFIKQLGSNPIDHDGNSFKLKHSKGGDFEEWPALLRHQEYPETSHD